MTSAKRKMSRKKERDAQKKMKEQINLFDKVGDKCMACASPFDKTSKEQATTWTVVVRKKEEKVNLYCPTCWSTAQEIITNFKKHKEEEGDV